MPTPAAAAPTQAEPKQTAGNIADAIKARAAGKTPGKGPETPAGTPDDGDEKKPAAAADPNAGKKRYVVEGKERWLSPAEADDYVQKGLAFEPRVSELDRIKREVAAFEQAMLNNPGAVIANLAKRANIPVQTMVEKVLSGAASDEVKEATGRWYWENVVKLQQMDPKDRELLTKDQRIKELEAQDKEKAETAIANENRERVSRALGEISGQISETLKELGFKDLTSPAAVRITKEIADVMRISYLSKQPCTAKQAAEKVKARINEYQRQFYDALDMDQLVEQLGKENAEKVRKYFLKAVKDAAKGTEQEAGKTPHRTPTRGERETIGMDDFHDYLDGLKRTSK